MSRPLFVKVDRDTAIPVSVVAQVQWNDPSCTAVIWTHERAHYSLSGIHAFEAVYQLCPGIAEGQRNWRAGKRAWMIHNLIAHPAMWVMAALGFRAAAFRLHDRTVPFYTPKDHK